MTPTLAVDDLPAYRDSALEAIEPFLERRPEPVVNGCTAAGFLGGPTGNASMVAALRARAGAPVVSTAAAMVDVLRHDGIAETAIVTPYLAAVNDGLHAYLGSAGIAAEVRAKALATVTPTSRALFIACSQLPTLDMIPELRRRLGISVWSSISATAWAAARALSAQAA